MRFFNIKINYELKKEKQILIQEFNNLQDKINITLNSIKDYVDFISNKDLNIVLDSNVNEVNKIDMLIKKEFWIALKLKKDKYEIKIFLSEENITNHHNNYEIFKLFTSKINQILTDFNINNLIKDIDNLIKLSKKIEKYKDEIKNEEIKIKYKYVLKLLKEINIKKIPSDFLILKLYISKKIKEEKLSFKIRSFFDDENSGKTKLYIVPMLVLKKEIAEENHTKESFKKIIIDNNKKLVDILGEDFFNVFSYRKSNSGIEVKKLSYGLSFNDTSISKIYEKLNLKKELESF